MSDSALYELHQKFGRLEVLTEQQYKQIHEWAKQTFSEQQQQISRLTSRIEALEKKCSTPTAAAE